ncbi:diablo homolog, mitochondrial-like isoform X2 [Carassius auratus]|uniref:Direct IAP-binding protein with low pI n=1 Tax=Carassius auratus TaxID=7957 RepID=A0A6P6LB27_CARAU|nr:diablo homolog, mitochondrial-like isoform X2 [Carassius auratus]XP_052473092.1 diablo IAP-binding mitochondrial protein-like isoform X2 [Carassius gibelio]
MQAFRNCGLCASGSLLKSRADFLVARRNLAVLRLSAACVQLLKDKANVFCRNPAPQHLLRLPEVARSNRVTFSLASSLCAVPFTQAENLSHESLIRRASCLVTDSANTYLSQTTLALVDALTQYAKELHTLIALQKRYINSIGKLTPAEEDSIWQVIIEQRVEVSDRLEACKRFESNWMNAINICELSADAAYNSGAEHACTATKTNLQVAQSKVEELRKISKEADKKLAETKAEEIQRMAEFASSISIPDLENEAYLRED